jgi:hypothetical protein
LSKNPQGSGEFLAKTSPVSKIKQKSQGARFLPSAAEFIGLIIVFYISQNLIILEKKYGLKLANPLRITIQTNQKQQI